LSVVDTILERSLETKILAVLASIEFNKSSIVATVECRVLSIAESIELIHKVGVITSKSSENDGKFTFAFLQVHESSEERRDQMIISLTKESSIHHSLVSLTFMFSFFFLI
jgi:hypothetical protein